MRFTKGLALLTVLAVCLSECKESSNLIPTAQAAPALSPTIGEDGQRRDKDGVIVPEAPADINLKPGEVAPPEPVKVNTEVSAWAKTDIEEMIKLGVVPADIIGNYKSNITREEYAKLASRVLGAITGAEEELEKVLVESRFSDTLSQEVSDVYKFGIVNGVTDTKFDPNRNISRQEAVVLMSNILQSVRVENLSKEPSKFIDRGAIAKWALEASDICYNAMLFQGTEAGMEPSKPYTREQSIVTMKRLIDFVKEVKGISYRGKIFILFEDIDDVRVGSNFVKIGSPKAKDNFSKYWQPVSSNFSTIPSSTEAEKITDGELTVETLGSDYLIKFSW